jgi:hypothetical protein
MLKYEVYRNCDFLVYYQYGQEHRKDGPSWLREDGYMEWQQYDILHRKDNYAIRYSNGGEEWRLNGKRHREDGPAVIFRGEKEYWVHGIRLDIWDRLKRWWKKYVNL